MTAARGPVQAQVTKAMRSLDWLADRGRRRGTLHLFGEVLFVRSNTAGEYTVRTMGTTYRELEYEELRELFASIAEQAHRDRLSSDRKETTQTHPQIGQEAP